MPDAPDHVATRLLDSVRAGRQDAAAEFLELVYGDTVPAALHGAAARSLSALVEYVREADG